MTTLAIMKARIALEVKRPDLTTNGAIANEITSAINHYRSKKFWFNQKRSQVTFNTVADQSDYTSADHADIPNLIGIDFITAVISGRAVRMKQIKPAIMELWLGDTTISSGQPNCYSYYAQALRFYQIPDDAYAIRVAGTVRVVAPATDDEADNPWMTDAEELIRMRAEGKICANWMNDPAAAQVASVQEQEAFDNLRIETSSRANVTHITPSGA